ncbi:hypothetical protein ACSQ67_011614 [Phaseolus vulgaris]
MKKCEAEGGKLEAQIGEGRALVGEGGSGSRPKQMGFGLECEEGKTSYESGSASRGLEAHTPKEDWNAVNKASTTGFLNRRVGRQ